MGSVDKRGTAGYLTRPRRLAVTGKAEQTMASNTDIVRRKRKRRHKNAGHQRKLQKSKHSTQSYDELFAALGEPGEPAPSQAE